MNGRSDSSNQMLRDRCSRPGSCPPVALTLSAPWRNSADSSGISSEGQARDCRCHLLRCSQSYWNSRWNEIKRYPDIHAEVLREGIAHIRTNYVLLPGRVCRSIELDIRGEPGFVLCP